MGDDVQEQFNRLRGLEPSLSRMRLSGIRRVPVPDGPPASLPRPPGSRRFPGEGFRFTMENWWDGLPTGGRTRWADFGQPAESRKSKCWGDLRGVASFRRSLLDPRPSSFLRSFSQWYTP